MPTEVSVEMLTASGCHSAATILGQWEDICRREFNAPTRAYVYTRDKYHGPMPPNGHFCVHDVIDLIVVLKCVFDMSMFENGGITEDDAIAHEIGHKVAAGIGFPEQQSGNHGNELDRFEGMMFNFTHHFPVYRLQEDAGGNSKGMVKWLCEKYVQEFQNCPETESVTWQSTKALFFADALIHSLPTDAEPLESMLARNHPLTYQRIIDIRSMIADCPEHEEGQFYMCDPSENLDFKQALIQRWRIPVRCEPKDIIREIRLLLALQGHDFHAKEQQGVSEE